MIRLFIALCALLNASCYLQAQVNKRVQQGSFEVIGVAARTTNGDEAGPNGVIPRIWQRLVAGGLLDQIPKKIDSDIVAVYSEYASDENGAYTFTLGAKVKPGTVAPEGMQKVQVPTGSYAVFTSARGPAAKVVPAEWQRIWSASSDGSLKRAFNADFELYGKLAADPKNAQVDIYVGLK